MRKQDKLKNIEQANLMLEQSYLKSKGIIKENYTVEEFINDFKSEEFFKPFLKAIVLKNFDLSNDWKKIITMDSKKLQDTFDLSEDIATKIYNSLQNKIKSTNPNTVDDRIDRLKTFFQGSGTGREKGWIKNMYTHFKQGGKIDDLEKGLKKVYLNSPGIFNFSEFTEEQFITMIEKLAEETGDESLLP